MKNEENEIAFGEPFEIPHSVRNDNARGAGKKAFSGGCATAERPLLPAMRPSSQTQRSGVRELQRKSIINHQ